MGEISAIAVVVVEPWTAMGDLLDRKFVHLCTLLHTPKLTSSRGEERKKEVLTLRKTPKISEVVSIHRSRQRMRPSYLHS